MCISTIVCYFLCDSETERPESILRERIGPGKKISDINTYLFWQKCSNSYWNDFSSKLKHIFQLGLGQNTKLLLSMFLFQIGTMYTFGCFFTWFQFNHSIFWTDMLLSKIHIFWKGHKRLKKSSTYYLVGTKTKITTV